LPPLFHGVLTALRQRDKLLALRRSRAIVPAIPSENLTIQDEIAALLKKAQQGSDEVKEFARDCLAHFRRECQAVFRDNQLVVASQLLETGTQEVELQHELEAKVEGVRQKLKERLKLSE
jgi:hypothetical protein